MNKWLLQKRSRAPPAATDSGSESSTRGVLGARTGHGTWWARLLPWRAHHVPL